MNQPIKWTATTGASNYPARPSGLMSLWSHESRDIAEIQRQGRLEGQREIARHKLRMFKSFLMKLEAMQLIDDADELMNYAEQKARHNPSRADIYIDATLKFIELQYRIHAINGMF